jgi:hypothetical protein
MMKHIYAYLAWDLFEDDRQMPGSQSMPGEQTIAA